jgi:hypothetical protein
MSTLTGPGLITDEQVAALSAATGTAEHGRWHARATLPVLRYGDPYRWVYTRQSGYESRWDGESRTARRELPLREVLAATGASREEDLTGELLRRHDIYRSREAAAACYVQGTVTGLLILRPGTGQRLVRDFLAATATVSSSRSRPGGIDSSQSQQRARAQAGSSAVAALLDAAGLAYRAGTGRQEPDGTAWDEIPGYPQPGMAAARDRIAARRTA